jgi:TRAP-type C4-dicarboxylate transport system permease small subunit
VFFAGSADRVYTSLGLDYVGQIWAYRALIVFAPPVVFLFTRRICRELQAADRVEAVSAAARRGSGEPPQAAEPQGR